MEIYVSFPLDSHRLGSSRSGSGLPVRVLARLRGGSTLAQADAELHGIARALVSDYPSAFRNPGGGLIRLSF